MRNGHFVDALTSVDVQEMAKIGLKVIEIYEGFISRKNFKVSPFKEVTDEVFELRRKFKEENNDVMLLLVKIITSSSYGEQIGIDIEESYEFKPEHWLLTEYNERVLDYQKIIYGNYIVKMKDDVGLQDEVKKNQHYASSIRCFRIIK